MHFIEIILIGLGLSFDTFAVSVSTGLTVNQIRFWQGVKVALVLAFFQGLMPLLGWLGGQVVEGYLRQLDHWIAFVLLAGLGLKILVDSFRESETKKLNPMVPAVLLGMAIATSIDALVVGVSLAFLEVDIWYAVAIIGFITFLASMLGMLLGKNVNGRFGKRVEVLGGLILVMIGLRILLSHLLT
ncbi:MAG: manganese efflux pump MntP family protein [Bacteroidales bacterium]|jgi:putative Mn2+ efflux pump MntP|nr:manganese efflux pump MntP family protein [Bacteroidales bacterium]NLM91565.1 manganese efflux pump [Bacteroidales bacterium]